MEVHVQSIEVSYIELRSLKMQIGLEKKFKRLMIIVVNNTIKWEIVLMETKRIKNEMIPLR